ncbi:Hypothetical predicted protein [Olea europaea subsp. europaea]|uniref:Uncharacterized protein n=1 Tax=Olea europaea subsp. europaea TaxID=158383 RepID=A0A8S0U2U2_OLEEU|nr:Hypothetical predicted protein [Olea europaea subsp. europaea]
MAAESRKPDLKISFIQLEGERNWRIDEEELAKDRKVLKYLEKFEREDESPSLARQLAERRHPALAHEN